MRRATSLSAVIGLLLIGGAALAAGDAVVESPPHVTSVWTDNLQTWVVTGITLFFGASMGTLRRVARGLRPYVPHLARMARYTYWRMSQDEAAGLWPPSEPPPPPPPEPPSSGVLGLRRRRP